MGKIIVKIKDNKYTNLLKKSPLKDVEFEINKTGFIETQNKYNIYYNFKNIHNKPNVSLNNFTWNDTLPTDDVRLDKIILVLEMKNWNMVYGIKQKNKIFNYLKIN